MTQQEKPISIVREELVNKIIQAINESNLSYFVLDYIFRDLYSEIHEGAIKQAQNEKAAYEQQLKQQDKEN